MDAFHKFGSTWFCLQLRDALNEQRQALGQLLEIESDAHKKLKPLILGMLSATQALTLLWPDRLLNEAHVLMRVLLERTVSLCCLTVTSPAEFEELFQFDLAPPVRPVEESGVTVDSLIAHAKSFANFGEEILTRTGGKLAILESRSKVNINAFRLSMAMHYPIALASLSGSPAGGVCHLKKGFAENPDAYFKEEFSALFLEANSLIHEAVKAVASIVDIEAIREQSREADKKAKILMQRIKEPIAPHVTDADGWWQTLPELEHAATNRIRESLSLFEPAFRICADLGLQVTVLPTDKPRTPSAKLSALFLKRILNDLRGAWMLVNCGYPKGA
jgi:hypothetical protein